jgi:hypothetical protein
MAVELSTLALQGCKTVVMLSQLNKVKHPTLHSIHSKLTACNSEGAVWKYSNELILIFRRPLTQWKKKKITEYT